MSLIPQQVGEKIRFFRKMRGYSLKEFSALLNCSPSTLSKYEHGLISLDIVTLSRIAELLHILPGQLIDSSCTRKDAPQFHNSTQFFRQVDTFYMYQLFPRYKRNAIIVGCLNIWHKDGDAAEEDVTYYFDLPEDAPDHTMGRSVYNGRIFYGEGVSVIDLCNGYNSNDRSALYVVNPFFLTTETVGLYVGISQSLRSPSAAKVLFSQNQLKIDAELRERLSFNKEELAEYRRINALVIR